MRHIQHMHTYIHTYMHPSIHPSIHPYIHACMQMNVDIARQHGMRASRFNPDEPHRVLHDDDDLALAREMRSSV